MLTDEWLQSLCIVEVVVTKYWEAFTCCLSVFIFTGTLAMHMPLQKKKVFVKCLCSILSLQHICVVSFIDLISDGSIKMLAKITVIFHLFTFHRALKCRVVVLVFQMILSALFCIREKIT